MDSLAQIYQLLLNQELSQVLTLNQPSNDTQPDVPMSTKNNQTCATKQITG